MDLLAASKQLTGDEVSHIRTMMDMTQNELGTLVGVEQSTIAGWERRGVQGPGAILLAALASTKNSAAPKVQLPEVRFVRLTTLAEKGFIILLHLIADKPLNPGPALQGIKAIKMHWSTDFKPVDAEQRASFLNANFLPIGGQIELSVAVASQANQALWELLADSNHVGISIAQEAIELLGVINVTSPPEEPFAQVVKWLLNLQQTFQRNRLLK